MKKRISTTVTIALLLAAVFLPIGALGLTEYLDSDGDNAPNDWTPTGCTTHSDCVDDAIRQPATGVDGNYLSAASQNVLDEHTYSNTVASGTVSDIEVWIYGRTGDSGDHFGILPGGVTGWTPSQVLTSAPGTSNSWVSSSWTGLSLDMSLFDSLNVELSSEQQASPGGTWVIETVYTELTYAVSGASLTVTLRKSDNTQERIGVGYWGNVSFVAADTNVYSSNYVRGQCDNCDGVDDAFWVNWSTTVWTSTSSSETIPIDGNFIYYYYETTSGTACPDDGGWSWSNSGVDADGDYQITFTNSGTTYVWVQFRIEDIASDDTLSAGIDYFSNAYTVELDR